MSGALPFVLATRIAAADVAPAGLTSPDQAADPSDAISAFEPGDLPLASTASAREAIVPPKPEYSRFGFSLGMGGLTATGNRGALWKSTEPMYDLAVYYWLAPEVSLHLEGSTVTNSYDTAAFNGGHVDVNVKHAELGARFYGDLHSLLPRVTPDHISAFATVGAGLFAMNRSSLAQSASEPDEIAPGMTLGAGLKFQVLPRRLAVELLGRWNSVSFKDTYSPEFRIANALPDLTGQILSWNANVLINL